MRLGVTLDRRALPAVTRRLLAAADGTRGGAARTGAAADGAVHPESTHAGKLSTRLRCFSKGCLESTLVNRSAEFLFVGTYDTVTMPAPRISRILYNLHSSNYKPCYKEVASCKSL